MLGTCKYAEDAAADCRRLHWIATSLEQVIATPASQVWGGSEYDRSHKFRGRGAGMVQARSRFPGIGVKVASHVIRSAKAAGNPSCLPLISSREPAAESLERREPRRLKFLAEKVGRHLHQGQQSTWGAPINKPRCFFELR